jgi:hypothetical protein
VIIVAFPFVFVATWLWMAAASSRRSGWAELARRFPGGPRPDGLRLDIDVLRVGPVNEKYATRLVPIPEGLYLDSAAVFRFRRPPAFLPWDLVRDAGEEGGLWRRGHVLDLCGITSIRVTQRAYQRITPYLSDRTTRQRA